MIVIKKLETAITVNNSKVPEEAGLISMLINYFEEEEDSVIRYFEDVEDFFNNFMMIIYDILTERAVIELQQETGHALPVGSHLFPTTGHLVTKRKCSACSYECPEIAEKFDMLTLHISEKTHLVDMLGDLVSSQVKSNVLCSHCNKRASYLQQASIQSLPTLLCIKIQRIYMKENGAIKKDSSRVSYPESLSMDEYMQQLGRSNLDGASLSSHTLKTRYTKYNFQLKAVIVHVGHTISSGHYVNYRRVEGMSGAKWYRTSDTEISAVAKQDALYTCAYILFYEMILTN